MIKVRIFCPSDPAGIVPGGIDTFIRGIIKSSPEDLEFSLVGMTTDTRTRPKGQWSRCRVGNRQFDFFPAIQVKNPGVRSFFPLSLRYMLAVSAKHTLLSQDFDIFDFHRIEPEFIFHSDSRAKNAFFHQNMEVIRDPNSDILWKYVPSVYEALERRSINRIASIWCVREDAVQAMRLRYAQKSEAINFIPTWVDTEIFSPLDVEQRVLARVQTAHSLGLSKDSAWIVSVGRLDRQKDPGLLISSFARLIQEGHDVELLVIGDGVLRRPIQRMVQSCGLAARVHFLGLMGAADIANILRVADMFALSSAYEGMPIAVLEALGSGLPVATTDVGEVRRVVKPGVNGAIAQDRSPEGFAACLADVLGNRHRYSGVAATKSIEAFRPSEVLGPVFENYRYLADRYRSRES